MIHLRKISYYPSPLSFFFLLLPKDSFLAAAICPLKFVGETTF